MRVELEDLQGPSQLKPTLTFWTHSCKSEVAPSQGSWSDGAWIKENKAGGEVYKDQTTCVRKSMKPVLIRNKLYQTHPVLFS